MNRESKNKLAIQILYDTRIVIDLSNDPLINDASDFNEIEAYFNSYSNKYKDDIFIFSKNNFQIRKLVQITPDLIKNILMLNPLEFEKLSSYLSLVLNYTDYYATKPTKDEGVDFIAERLDNDSLNTNEILFGQCKKFESSLVKVNEIRELAGAITLFKKGEFMSDKSYITIAEKIKSHSSIKTIFVTSNFFSEEALKLCSNSGIVPIDIIDLVHIFIIGMKKKIINWANSDLDLFDHSLFIENISSVKIIY